MSKSFKLVVLFFLLFIQHPLCALTHGDLDVDVTFIRGKESKSLFYTSRVDKYFTPVKVTITNRSDSPYYFSKYDIDRPTFPSNAVYDKVRKHPFSRLTTWGTSMVGAFVFNPLLLGSPLVYGATTLGVTAAVSVVESSAAAWNNGNVYKRITKNEIPDVELAPGETVTGVIYLGKMQAQQRFKMTLTNGDSGAPLAFAFKHPS